MTSTSSKAGSPAALGTTLPVRTGQHSIASRDLPAHRRRIPARESERAYRTRIRNPPPGIETLSKPRSGFLPACLAGRQFSQAEVSVGEHIAGRRLIGMLLDERL